MFSGIETAQECECEANKFYQKYKDKIEKILSGKYVRIPSDTELQGEETDAEKGDGAELQEGAQKHKHGGEGKGESGSDLSFQSQRYGVDAKSLGGWSTADTYSQKLAHLENLFADKLRYLFELRDQGEGEYQGSHRTEMGYLNLLRDKVLEEEYGQIYKIPSISASAGEEEEVSYKIKIEPEGPWSSESQRRAESYLKKHHIYDIFHFLGSHLVASNSDNPIDFLVNLLENCLNYRKGLAEPPLLFTQRHVESLMDSMDHMKTGFIELDQYHTGMLTLGIGMYDQFPITIEPNQMIERKIFIDEAIKRMTLHLDKIIAVVGESPVSTAIWPTAQPSAVWSNLEEG